MDTKEAMKIIRDHPEIMEALKAWHDPRPDGFGPDRCGAHYEGMMCCVDHLIEGDSDGR